VNQSYTKAERAHLERVKSLPCSVCDLPGPSEAHHCEQSQAWTCVALCESCHRGPINGWHGQRRAWKLRKLDELGALNITIKRLMEQT
jgi:hypothetical protein